MASAGKNGNGSQFFLTLGSNAASLDGRATLFGEVAEGWEVLQKLNEALLDDAGRPLHDIRVRHTYVLHDPFDDPPGLEALLPPSSPKRKKPLVESVPERLDPEDLQALASRTALSKQALEERIAEEEARSRAVVLEMVGDLPSADIAPPENVLFVCKLHPITNEEALHVIFSQNGTVKQCVPDPEQREGKEGGRERMLPTRQCHVAPLSRSSSSSSLSLSLS